MNSAGEDVKQYRGQVTTTSASLHTTPSFNSKFQHNTHTHTTQHSSKFEFSTKLWSFFSACFEQFRNEACTTKPHPHPHQAWYMDLARSSWMRGSLHSTRVSFRFAFESWTSKTRACGMDHKSNPKGWFCAGQKDMCSKSCTWCMWWKKCQTLFLHFLCNVGRKSNCDGFEFLLSFGTPRKTGLVRCFLCELRKDSR